MEEAKDLLQTDPAIKSGLLDYEIFSWNGSAALPEYLPSEAELFLPNTKNTFILKSSNKETYENGEYKFDSKDSSLYINGTKAYSVQDTE